jgi:hypothetical protein
MKPFCTSTTINADVLAGLILVPGNALLRSPGPAPIAPGSVSAVGLKTVLRDETLTVKFLKKREFDYKLK